MITHRFRVQLEIDSSKQISCFYRAKTITRGWFLLFGHPFGNKNIVNAVLFYYKFVVKNK
jgi:hypothetical protein